MEAAGCAFDVTKCRAAHTLASADVAALEDTWKTAAGPVNPASPAQLARFLYEDRKFPIPPVNGTLKAVKRTRRDELPTSEAALDWLYRKAQRPENKQLLKTLLELRKVTKLAQFLEKLPGFVDDAGYLHAAFGVDTGTGRLASRNPNLQNIPAGKADRYGIRGCFVAPLRQRLLVADYSALEPRILAHWLITLFDDHTLAEALETGDLYAAVALRTWPDKLKGINADQVKEHPDPGIRQLRSFAKVIVLGTNYGKSVNGLAVQLDIAADAAQTLRDDYFRAYPGIPRFQRWAADCARATGRVYTLLGRYRELPEIYAREEGIRAKAERQAVNSIIQGSAADIVMLAMQYQRPDYGVTLQLQVHDELVWRIPQDVNPESWVYSMQRPGEELGLQVPLKIDWHLVDAWSEAK